MSHKSFWLSGNGVAACLLVAAATYFLLMEHRQHLFQALPYLIILLCPLMHLFMHRDHGHGGHSARNNHSDKDYQQGYEAGRRDADKQDNDSTERGD